ncbi:MAG: hypothetical protein AAB433_20565 [Nitrospirota bacterium]
MLHSPFKIFLAGFGSVDFSFGCFVAGLPESMRQDQSPTDEEKTQDSIGLDLALKDLVRFGQMLELAFIPYLPRVSHARKQRSKLLLPPKRKLFEPYFCRRSPAGAT